VIAPVGRAEVAPLLARRHALSPREREVLAHAARGAPTKQIAAALGISVYTVQDHIDRACDKLGVRGRAELLARLFLDGTGG
jgi:DNA-binding CsgD family transcriptional regulator